MQIPTNWNQLVESVERNGDRLQLIAIIIIVTWVLQYVVIRWIHYRSKGTVKSSSIVVYLIRWGIILMGVVFVLNAMNQPITPIITALGIGGLAVALGLQDTLSNLFAGLNILASKQIRLHDDIELVSKKRGIVADITWRHTVLEDGDDVVIIPNSVLVKEVVTNHGKPKKK